MEQGQWRWFLEDLRDWVTECGFARVLVLAGADGSRRRDAELQRQPGSVYFLQAEPTADAASEESPDWLSRLDHLATRMEHAPHPEFEPDSLLLPGAGPTAQFMLRQLSTVAPVTVLYLYTFEGMLMDGVSVRVLFIIMHRLGENLPESVELGRALLKLLQLPVPARQAERMPKAWRHLYGDQPDASLFQ